MKQQDGQNILTSWFQSGAIEKIGVIKTTCVEKTKRVRKPVIVSAEEAAALDEQGLLND